MCISCQLQVPVDNTTSQVNRYENIGIKHDYPAWKYIANFIDHLYNYKMVKQGVSKSIVEYKLFLATELTEKTLCYN